MIFCFACGHEIHETADSCPKCGAKSKNLSEQQSKKLATALFCFFLGGLGIHRFYLGRTGSAIALLLISLISWPLMFIGVGAFTGFIVFVWVVIDFIRIILTPSAEFNDRWIVRK